MADNYEIAMRLLADMIETRLDKGEWERWEDPGDYPNGLAAGPLPPGEPEFTWDDESPYFISWEKLPEGVVFEEGDGLVLAEDRTTSNHAVVDWTITKVRADSKGLTITLSCKTEPEDCCDGPE